MKTKWQKMKDEETKANRIVESAEDIENKFIVDDCIAKGVKDVKLMRSKDFIYIRVLLNNGTYAMIPKPNNDCIKRLEGAKNDIK